MKPRVIPLCCLAALIAFVLWNIDDSVFKSQLAQYRIYFYDTNGHIIAEYEGEYKIRQEKGMICIEDSKHKKTYFMGTVFIESR